MNGESKVIELADIALDEAVVWRVRLTEHGLDTSLEFEAWLSNSANRFAWSRVNSVWEYFGEHSEHPILREASLKARASIKCVRSSRGILKRAFRAAELIAAVLVFMVVLSGGHNWFNHSTDYKTAFGERRTVILSDGSKILLDSESEVIVNYSERSRELQVIKGQARFGVAHDVERPFSVQVRNQTVIATGTDFNINLAGQRLLVTLIEGHVLVVDDIAHTEARSRNFKLLSVALAAGQQLEQDASQSPSVRTVNIDSATSWSSGQLIFDDQTLASVVEQMNRYSPHQLIIGDPAIATMHISGVFNTGDIPQFLKIITHYLPVRSVLTESGSIRIEKGE